VPRESGPNPKSVKIVQMDQSRLWKKGFCTDVFKSGVKGRGKWQMVRVKVATAPCQASDFRPISITPVLSRVLERYVVCSHVYPALLRPCASLDFSDQFAFRPSGSTMAAIVAMLHTVRTMLAENDFVQVFSFDFSKAFDTIRHSTLMAKFAQLQMPDCIHNWICDFLDGHAHCTKYASLVSAASKRLGYYGSTNWKSQTCSVQRMTTFQSHQVEQSSRLTAVSAWR